LGILAEAQIKELPALLRDRESPVNKNASCIGSEAAHLDAFVSNKSGP
jgi:hypothetical protein